MSVENWKSLFDWGTVILLFLTFAFGAGALITGNIIGKQQEGKSRLFEKDLTEAKTRLGAQETDAANAKAEMAKQQTRAAEAEKALLELQQRLADRHVTVQQRETMIKMLKGHDQEHVIVQSLISGGREALQYASELAAIFREAGWDVEPPNGRGGFDVPISGVFIVGNQSFPKSIGLVENVLIAGGIAKSPVKISPNQNPKGIVEIWVADKPAK